MATYNGALYLREQLESILVQLHPEDELIISDDHSTDDTRSIIASYKDPRIKMIMNTGKTGHVGNFSNAMAHATGEFIALSDQDDIWVEKRLDRMVALLQGLRPHSLVVGDIVEFDSNGVRANQRPLGPTPANKYLQMLYIYLGRSIYCGCAFLFRRELTRYVLPIPSYIISHDLFTVLCASVHGKVVHLEEKTLMHRLHGNNKSPLRRGGLWYIMRSRVINTIGLLQSSFR
jgi:glycosyltransferase involved in cell wall biosynthesis